MQKKNRVVPIIGPLTTLIGYPFWIFGKKLGAKADEEASKQADGRQTGPVGTPDELERRRLAEENERLHRELQSSPPPRAPVAPSAAGGSRLSIGEELAALERSLGARGATATPSPPWENPLREAFDSDGDGRMDLIRIYD